MELHKLNALEIRNLIAGKKVTAQEVVTDLFKHIEQSEPKIKAFVVPRPGEIPSREELLDLCRRRLEEYAVPWDIEFLNTLPKSPVGRVLRRLLVGAKSER